MQNIKDIIPSFLWQIIKNDWHGPRKCARIYRQTRTCGTRMHVHGLQDVNPVLIQDPEFSNNGKKSFMLCLSSRTPHW